MAWEKKTGVEKYRIDRPNRTRSYCTPVFYEVNGREQMILSGSKSVTGYDPETGASLWVVDGPTEQYVASLVMTDGVVFMTAGFPEHHLLGIDPAGTGNITQSPHVLWHEKKDHRAVSYVPSPVALGKWFFLVSDGGIGTCWEARDGTRLWKEQLSNHQSASGIVAGGNAYFTADDGETTVFKAGPRFELVSKNAPGRGVPGVTGGERGEVVYKDGAYVVVCWGIEVGIRGSAAGGSGEGRAVNVREMRPLERCSVDLGDWRAGGDAVDL